MEKDDALKLFFEQCDYLAARWRFDALSQTAEEVFFDREDENNFVESFQWFHKNETTLPEDTRNELRGKVDGLTNAIVEALRVPKIGTRRRMIRLIGRLGITEASHALTIIATAAESPEEREGALAVLGEISLIVAEGVAVWLLSNPNNPDQLRATAAETLGLVDCARHVELLTAALRTADQTLSRACAEVLMRVPAEQVLPSIERLWKDRGLQNFARLRTAEIAIRVRGAPAEKETVEESRHFIESSILASDRELARIAINMTVDLGLDSRSSLKEAVRIGSNTIRTLALESLAKVGAQQDLLAFIQLVGDESEDVGVRIALRRFPETTHLCSPEMTQAF
jgi:HEAT repeat protein